MSQIPWDSEWEDPRWVCGLDSRLRGRLKDGFSLLTADGDDVPGEGEERGPRYARPSILAYSEKGRKRGRL